MSFIRPELAQRLRPWTEVILTGATGLFGLYLLWRGHGHADLFLQLAGLAIAVPALVLTVPAVRAVLLRSSRLDPGIVEITERQVTYLGPHFGGVVSIGALTGIDIVVTANWQEPPDIFWTLRHRDGPDLSVPFQAEGADHLPDAFAALPGFRMQAVLQAMRAGESGVFAIWKSA